MFSHIVLNYYTQLLEETVLDKIYAFFFSFHFVFFGCLLFVWFVFEVLFWVCCFVCFGLVVFCAVFTGLPSKPALLNAEWRLLLSISHWDLTTRIMKSHNKKQQLWSNFQSWLPREIACYWSKLRALCKKKLFATYNFTVTATLKKAAGLSPESH